MTGNLIKRTLPSDVVETISDFRSGSISLGAFLDRVWAQIHDLREIPAIDLGTLEDSWMDIEIAYASASAAGQPHLDSAQRAAVDAAIDGLVAELMKGL